VKEMRSIPRSFTPKRFMALLLAMAFFAFSPQAQTAAARQNCGTFWTGWMDNPDADVNPCPKGCVRGERQILNTHKNGDTIEYEARYQCYKELPSGETAAMDHAPREKPQPSSFIATLSPASGPWHTFVRIKGNGLGSTSSVRVVWYPNDDDSQPPAGAITATLRNSFGPDEIEIEIPSDSGIGSGGAIRVMLTLPGRTQPVYAGTFSVTGQTQTGGVRLVVPQLKAEPEGGIKPPSEPYRPPVITTESLYFTGTRRPPFVPKVISTEKLQLTGTRRPPFVPKVISTEKLQLTGTRRPPFVPKVISTEKLQLTGTRRPPLNLPTDRQIEIPPPPPTVGPVHPR
jgi:hypothetical protein